MNKFGLKYGFLLLSLLLCLLPAGAYAGNALSGSFTVSGVNIILAAGNPTYTSLTLSWISPQTMFDCGPAIQYDIRYSLSPITTEAAWQAATSLVNPPTPGQPGSPETVTVIGLNPCTTYYFAIKAADECRKWTALSNSPSGTTLCYPGGGGGGGGGLPASSLACPATLTVNMQGNITTTSMTRDGVLCKVCLAKDSAGKNTLELNKDTRLVLADNAVPLLIRVRASSVTLPTAENIQVVSPVYEFNAYASATGTTPSPVTISPPARLILSYDPNSLPQNTTEVFIANYDTQQGWLALAPVPGVVVEIGKTHGLLSHFSLFAVIAIVEEPTTKFKVSNLTVNPSQIQLNEAVAISVNVANTGGKSGDYNLELKVDGKVKSTTQVTVATGASRTVNFTLTGDTAGKHQVEVAGLIGEFEVIKPAAPPVINWWLIGGITLMVLAIWAIFGWRWFKDRKKAAVTSSDE